MNNEDIALANELLKFFAEQSAGKANTDMWDNDSRFAKYDYILRGNIRTILEQRGYLIPLDEKRYWDMLTQKGWKAAKMGIEEYEKQEEENQKPKPTYQNNQGNMIIGDATNATQSVDLSSEKNASNKTFVKQYPAKPARNISKILISILKWVGAVLAAIVAGYILKSMNWI